jgi:hypothetical protein
VKRSTVEQISTFTDDVRTAEAKIARWEEAVEELRPELDQRQRWDADHDWPDSRLRTVDAELTELTEPAHRTTTREASLVRPAHGRNQSWHGSIGWQRSPGHRCPALMGAMESTLDCDLTRSALPEIGTRRTARRGSPSALVVDRQFDDGADDNVVAPLGTRLRYVESGGEVFPEGPQLRDGAVDVPQVALEQLDHGPTGLSASPLEVEDPADLLQAEAERSGSSDEPEYLDVAFAVRPVPRLGALGRREDAFRLVETDRLGTHPGPPCRLSHRDADTSHEICLQPLTLPQGQPFTVALYPDKEMIRMSKRQVEVFTAGCPMCDPAVQLVQELACPDCEVTVYDVRDSALEKARQYGVNRVPTVVVDGTVAACCQGGEVSREQLEAAGIGQRL